MARPGFTFSQREKHDLFIAWVLISIAFGIIWREDAALGTYGLYGAMLISALTVGVGFFFHELAHKYVAQYYGKYAEFYASIPFLVLAVFMSFFGFVFAAPGAVVVSGYCTKREWGHIAVAGPLTNITLALIALPFFFIFKVGFFAIIIEYFFRINVWLALFNMIPLWVLDGAKVLAWSKKWYFITLILALALFFVQFLPR